MTSHSRPAESAGNSSIGVLVVEDERIAANAHAQYVSRLDEFHLAGIATNAGQAVAALTGQLPGLDPKSIQLVLLDMNLPDGHGLQLCRVIRAKHIPVDVIAVTAARDMTIVQEAIALGIVQYLIKPFTFPAFKAKLTGYLGFRSSIRPADPEAALTQTEVDEAMAALRDASAGQTAKGVSDAVQEQVLAALADGQALSAAELGDAIGVSRVTARRYLEALADVGTVQRRPRYGATGRPVLEYLEA